MIMSAGALFLASLGPLAAHGATAAPVIDAPAENALVRGVFAVSGTATPASYVEVYEGAVRIGRTQANARGAWRTDVGLNSGERLITARALDGTEVPSPSTTPRTIFVDAQRPSVEITTPDESTFSTATNAATITGTATDQGPTESAGVKAVELKYFESTSRLLVRTEMATCSPACPVPSVKWITNVGLFAGAYRVEVRAIDSAGNRSKPATISFTQAGATQVEASCTGTATLADGGSCSEVFLVNGSRYVSTIGTSADLVDFDARGTLTLNWFDASGNLVVAFGCTGTGLPVEGATRVGLCTQHGPARSEYTPGLQTLVVTASLTDCPAESCAFHGRLRLAADTDLI
ncbi:MAG: hypothetical protein WDA27_10160 [Actinomycetota bacterium]